MQERLHELLFPKDFDEMVASFLEFSGTDGLYKEIAITFGAGNPKRISFITRDGIPSHAKVETYNIMEDKDEDTTTLADLVSLYLVTEKVAPRNELTRTLKRVVLRNAEEARLELSHQLDSAEILVKRIEATDGRQDRMFSDHP